MLIWTSISTHCNFIHKNKKKKAHKHFEKLINDIMLLFNSDLVDYEGDEADDSTQC